MNKQSVIAIIDVGKTNKKLFLFDEDYNIVEERSAKFNEVEDEDGFACENLESLKSSVFESLNAALANDKYDVKAVNFSTYGASFVYVDENANALTPLYNYLKPYPEDLKKKFYEDYGGEQLFSALTASPVLGSLNSGMQLYRLKYEKPAIFEKIKHALHLPQYLSYLLTNKGYSDLTSIGCHTNLWNFNENTYHEWVSKEGVDKKLAPIEQYNSVYETTIGDKKLKVGIGLHDSSSALIPYLINFSEPFILISSGTWCITLNPFNNAPLTSAELKQDCLCYIHYKGLPVKASRLFAGMEHEEQVKRIAEHFNVPSGFYKNIDYDAKIVAKLPKLIVNDFAEADLSVYSTIEEVYHAFIVHIMRKQVASTNLVLQSAKVKRIFVDGGFSKNPIYMNLLANAYPNMEVFAATVSQATALGAALAMHDAWNSKTIPSDIIGLKYFNKTV